MFGACAVVCVLIVIKNIPRYDINCEDSFIREAILIVINLRCQLENYKVNEVAYRKRVVYEGRATTNRLYNRLLLLHRFFFYYFL